MTTKTNRKLTGPEMEETVKQSRYELFSNYFLSFNMVPDRNQALLEYQLEETKDVPFSILSKTLSKMPAEIKTLSLPRISVLFHHILKNTKKTKSSVKEDCILCDGDGLVYTAVVLTIDDGKKVEKEIDLNYKGESPDLISKKAIGKCKCKNGLNFSWFVDAEYPEWVIKEARENNWSCSFQIQLSITKMNRAIYKGEEEEEKPLKKVMGDLVKQIERNLI